ncbi:MAG: response regulator [Lentisphaerae bacterium]|nr:response regulator [Lentisphaerota bacterium]
MNESPVTGILLVEDNPKDLELTLRVLRKAGLAAATRVARDGAEALAYLADADSPAALPGRPIPRLILLDLKLPKADGHEVLAKIKGDARTRSIPVVILTSSREPRDIASSYQAGANSYIVKPVNYEQFAATLMLAAQYWLQLNESSRPEG